MSFCLNKNTTFFASSYNEPLSNMNEVLQESKDISASIISYNKYYSDLLLKSGNFKNDILDSNGNIIKKNTIQDAINEDIHTILIQENTLYIVGFVTTVTLIITAFLLSK